MAKVNPTHSNETESVSVMIFTLNEEIHLQSCLNSLQWCKDIIVVDSFSTDHTNKICKSKNIRFFQNQFEGFGTQRNWALENCSPINDWVLILDADERVTPELSLELIDIANHNPTDVAAYRVKRRFHMWGRWLRYSSLYPTWVVRFIHKDRVHYINRGHAETQEVKGIIGELKFDLIDENLKGIDEWFERQNRYSSLEAKYELELNSSPFHWGDCCSLDPLRRRASLKRIANKLPARSFLYFIYSYFLRFGFLDGRDGLVFCVMKTVYQQMITVKKYDLRKRSGNG